MIATLINVFAIILGSVIGILIGRFLKESYKQIVYIATGIFCMVIGIKMALGTDRLLYLAFALVLGGLAGTLLNIEQAVLNLGHFIKNRIARREQDNTFANGFLDASVLFCMGAMAIVGSFKAGTEGDYTLILTKSILDGFISILFASAMGIGVAFSALSVLIYQGSLTLLSVLIKDQVSPLMISEVSSAGGVMIIMIGINLMGLKKIPTGNFLPAILFMILFVLFDPWIAGTAQHLFG